MQGWGVQSMLHLWQEQSWENYAVGWVVGGGCIGGTVAVVVVDIVAAAVVAVRGGVGGRGLAL